MRYPGWLLPARTQISCMHLLWQQGHVLVPGGPCAERRILDSLGADVRVFNPEGLPMKDEASEASRSWSCAA